MRRKTCVKIVQWKALVSINLDRKKAKNGRMCILYKHSLLANASAYSTDGH